MNDCCDLELTIHRQDSNYAVDFHFSRGDASGATDRLGMLAPFDLGALQKHAASGNGQEYAKELTDQLFKDEALKRAFGEARAAAGTLGAGLRLRLNIHPDLRELYTLRWEMLTDPASRRGLSTDQTVYFSRYYSSSSFKPFIARPRAQLKALIMVAGPQDVDGFEGLKKVPKQAEEDGIAASLGDIAYKKLERSSLARLKQELTSEEYDVLYLVAHGRYIQKRNDGFLYLEGEDGKTDVVSATQFVEEIAGLAQPPRLMVLASCESAGSGTGDVLSALGPRLADAGIPAVLAMQDALAMDTNIKFMPLFFKELQKHGQIDRALSVARSQVQQYSDFWVPVLFMRLENGLLWQVSSGQLVSQGTEAIKASAEIIKLSPESYANTIKSFEVASRQINRMADYKDMHDGLHRLQYGVFNVAMEDKKYFPDDLGRRLLDRSLGELDRILTELKAITIRPGVDPIEKVWVADIEEAKQVFKEALREKNTDGLEEALYLLNSVLADRPTRINGILTEAARALELSELAAAMQSTVKGIPSASPEAVHLGKVEAGAQAIEDLDRKLTALVNNHDAWQDVVGNLRRVEMEGNPKELKMMWRSVKKKVTALFQDRPEEWALELSASSDALDQALTADDPGAIADNFRAYNSQVGTRFFNVDCDLKELCTQIRDISGPLKEAIESIGRTGK